MDRVWAEWAVMAGAIVVIALRVMIEKGQDRRRDARRKELDNRCK